MQGPRWRWSGVPGEAPSPPPDQGQERPDEADGKRNVAPEAAVGGGGAAALVLGGTAEGGVDRARRWTIGGRIIWRRLGDGRPACRTRLWRGKEFGRRLEPCEQAPADGAREGLEAAGLEPRPAKALGKHPQLTVDHAEALHPALEARAMRIRARPDPRDLDTEAAEVGRLQRALFDSVGKSVESSGHGTGHGLSLPHGSDPEDKFAGEFRSRC